MKEDSIDESGVSFSYEKENPQVKQNFFISSAMSWGYFAITGFSLRSTIVWLVFESEANLFSFVLMPSIVVKDIL